jgi:hypothetical protein
MKIIKLCCLLGVNLEVALTECYERMDAIGVATAEV